jgi:hypothetical protein
MEYRRELNKDKWTARRSSENFDGNDIAVNMVKSLESLENTTKLPDEKIDGVDCFHFKSSVDADAEADKILAGLDPSEPGYEAQLKLIEWQRSKLEEYEFWIGKEDFLLRRMNAYIETSPFRSEGEEGEQEERRSAHNNFRFYDFNEPIIIEAPVEDYIEGVSLTVNSTSSVSNRRIETAYDVQVFVDSPTTNQGLKTMEAEAERHPTNLKPGESLKYLISWEYDLSLSSKEDLIDLLRQTVIRATWTDDNGERRETDK